MPERRPVVLSMLESTSIPEIEPGSAPTWDTLLATTREWPKLDTPVKRLQAVLNVAKNGAMVLEVISLQTQSQAYTDINRTVNTYGSDRFVLHHGPTRGHFVQTLEDVGVAAKGDIDNIYWTQTEFGNQAKAVLLFIQIQLLGLGIDPKSALGTSSHVKTETPGNKDTTILASPALTRFQILCLLGDGRTLRIEDIFDQEGINVSRGAIKTHLERLQSIGLVEYQSADLTEGYTQFELKTGNKPTEWSTPSTGRRIAQTTAEACIALSDQNEPITYKTVTRYLEEKNGKLPHTGLLINVLRHFVEQDYLERNNFISGNQSEARLSALGQTVVGTVFKPVWLWCQDPQSVAQINEIDANLQAGPHRYKWELDQIADNFVDNKSRDLAEKTGKVLTATSRQSGQNTVAAISRETGISNTHVSRIISRLNESGVVSRTKGRGRKQHLQANRNLQ